MVTLSFMYFLVTVLDKTFMTVLTFKWLFSCVQHLVFFQMLCFPEDSFAFITLKGFFSSVNAFMDSRLKFISECFITTLEAAHKWP